MKNPIIKMLRTHKEYCKMVEPRVLTERSCTCGRDEALELYNDMEDYLILLDSWLEEHDVLASNSVAHHKLEQLIERL